MIKLGLQMQTYSLDILTFIGKHLNVLAVAMLTMT